MQRYRHYGNSYSSSQPSSAPVEEVHAEEEVFEEEGEPPVVQEPGRTSGLMRSGPDWAGFSSGLVWLG